MIVRRAEARLLQLHCCHGGEGSLSCLEYIGDYHKGGLGIAFIHDDIIPPGTSIGEHSHAAEEEIYVVLEGEGTMTIDGVPQKVTAGDVCITRRGHSHGLLNSGEMPLRLLVVGVSLGPCQS